MSTRIDYTEVAAKVDYSAVEKKLEELGQRERPKRRKTAGDMLEPLRERLLALHRKGWSSGQLASELKAAGVPIGPACLRECLSRWNGNGNGSTKRRERRPEKPAVPVHPATNAATTPARNLIRQEDGQTGEGCTQKNLL